MLTRHHINLSVFSAGLTLCQFEGLRSLVLKNVSSDPTITQDFFTDLHRLRHLTHLKFVDCSFMHQNRSDFQGVIDQIWNLPQLTHFYLNCRLNGHNVFLFPQASPSRYKTWPFTRKFGLRTTSLLYSPRHLDDGNLPSHCGPLKTMIVLFSRHFSPRLGICRWENSFSLKSPPNVCWTIVFASFLISLIWG